MGFFVASGDYICEALGEAFDGLNNHDVVINYSNLLMQFIHYSMSDYIQEIFHRLVIKGVKGP